MCHPVLGWITYVVASLSKNKSKSVGNQGMENAPNIFSELVKGVVSITLLEAV